MKWRYAITTEVDLPIHVKIGGHDLLMDINASRLRPATIIGGINFTCRTPPEIAGLDFGGDHGGWFCKLFDLVEVPPKITQQLNVDAYEQSNAILGAVQNLPQIPGGYSVDIQPPTATVTSRQSVVSTDNGKCYNVRIRSDMSFQPGVVSVSFPDVPIPGFGNISVPDLEFPIGSAFRSLFTIQYRICCCSWTTALDELPVYDEASDGEFELFPPTIHKVTADPTGDPTDVLGSCNSFSSTYLTHDIAGDETHVTWKCKAEEGPCMWRMVRVYSNGNPRTKKLKGGRHDVIRPRPS